jgi:hypothetical protein
MVKALRGAAKASRRSKIRKKLHDAHPKGETHKGGKPPAFAKYRQKKPETWREAFGPNKNLLGEETGPSLKPGIAAAAVGGAYFTYLGKKNKKK